MSFTKSRYLAVASGHTDALIEYVLDVKPYHTKLSEIVEKYEINDDVNVKIAEDHQILAFLGADILESSIPYPGVRARRSNTWWRELISDSNRKQWSLPFTSVHKFLSHVGQETFIGGQNDDTQIPGIENFGAKVFSPRRWDGPSVTNVRKQGEHQQESFDYFLSHGVYTFETRANQRWKEHNIAHIPAFAESTGVLLYQDVVKAYATISNITPGNFDECFDEWTLTCVNETPPTLEVSGLRNGAIGTVEFNSTFEDLDGEIVFGEARIRFDFGPAPDQVDSLISVGDTFVLTPYHKITVAEDAPEETWSLIKTNPIVVEAKPEFTTGASSPPRLYQPALEIHTRSLDRVTVPSSWSVVFNGNGTYNLSKMCSENPYIIENIDLKDGCSFKNEDIHFTIIPTIEGFFAGDTFNFTIGDRVENFLVYGSESGWQDNAKIGEWYWNGKIGFKIPKLEYFASMLHTTVSASATGDDQSWVDVVQNAQVLRSVSYNGAFYVAGERSIVGASQDGVTWTPEIIPPGPGQLIVVVGQDGTIATSSDGQEWISHDTDTDVTLRGSTLIPDLLATRANSDPIIISQTETDRLDLASVVLNDDRPLDLSGISIWRVVGGLPQEVSVPFWYDSTTDTLYLYDPSQPVVDTVPFNVNDEIVICYSLNMQNCIVVVGDRGKILTSTTGLGWATRTSGTLNNLNAVTWSNDAIVVVGDGGTILRSEDRINWAPISFGISVLGTLQQSEVHFNDIIYNQIYNAFIVVGSNGVIIRSIDGGLSWTRVANTWDNPLERDVGLFSSVAYGDGKFVAVGPDGFIASSTDAGVSWTRYRGKKYNSIAFGNGTFVAVGGTKTTMELFTKIKDVHSIAEPSVYTITFQPPVAPQTAVQHATVVNNIYGYRKSLTVNEVWEDEFCSFKIDSIPGQFECAAGDTIRVHLAPEYTYAAEGWYDEHHYETPLYDTGVADITVPWLYNEEYFPLYHSHGAVIFKDGCSDGDRVVIDKALLDVVRLRILGAGTVYPELASVDGWIPLEFRYFDRAVSPASLYDGRTAHFPDLTTHIEAYLCSDPTVKVFTIDQPRYQCTNRTASASIRFDDAFFQNYLPFNTSFSFRVQPDSSYGQKLRVKITENLRVYTRIRLEFAEGPEDHYWIKRNIFFDGTQTTTQFLRFDPEKITVFDLVDGGLQETGTIEYTDYWSGSAWNDFKLLYPFSIAFEDESFSGINIVGNLALDDLLNITVIEGGALPIVFNYDEMPFNMFAYDQRYAAVIPHAIEIAPGVYEYDETVTQPILPRPISGSPGTFVSEESTETTGTSFLEGFTFVEKLAAPVQPFAWVSGDGPILVTHNLNTLDVAVTVRDGVGNIIDTGMYTAGLVDVNYIFITPASDMSGAITVVANRVDRVSKMYDFAQVPVDGLLIEQQASEYLITHNGPAVSPTLIVESLNNTGVFASPIPNMMPFEQFPTAVSARSFSFELPPGFTAPFRLRIT